MSYQLINEKLGIYSCEIGDLTLTQVQSFLKLWGDNSTIGSLTVFYVNDGKIVLNKDHNYFEQYKELAINYLEVSEKDRIELKSRIDSKALKEVFSVLDLALKYREIIAEQQAMNEKWKDIKRIVKLQSGPSFETAVEIREQFYDEVPIYIAVSNIYNYGVIQGKRLERAKKKKIC